MSKQDSLMVKGLAILMMLFLHLFNEVSNCNLCYNYITIGGLPLTNILSRSANPVDFFLFLSGFGLYISNKKSADYNVRNLRRLIILYIHFWIILTIFLSIGCIIKPDRYPGSATELLGNYTSFSYSYNSVCWFLLPYAVLALLSPLLVRLLDRSHYIVSLVIAFVIRICTSFLISRYGQTYLFDNQWIYDPFLVFHFLFSFTIGMTCAKTNFWGLTERFRNHSKAFLLWFVFMLAVVIRCLFETSIFNPFYALAIVMIFICAPKSQKTRVVFEKLGVHSMNMWMIHAWFCIYLFKDFIYGFKYPILIFLVLLAISYIVSILINYIAKPVTKLVLR